MRNEHANELRRLVRAICVGGISTLTLSTISAPSMAAAAAANAQNSDELEEIVVTGIRSSLQKSLDIKKDAVGVVDAISAEDIGKFPDSNIAASMARIPGITVSRGAQSMGGAVPTSTGEATQVTVRGFGPDFNTTLFSGRQLASSTGARGFDFSSVGSDFVSAIDVNKTPDATLSSGAIGATINIVNRLPFDKPGLQLSGSLSGTYSTGEGKTTPNFSGLFSDTFADDTFGVLADVSYAETKTQGNHINIQGWEGLNLSCPQFADPSACNNDGTGKDKNPSWFIQDYGIYQEHDDEKRTGIRAALQWKPVGNLLFTLDENYSKDNLQSVQYAYSVWFNGGSLQDVVRAPDGTITSFNQPGTPTDFQGEINSHIIVDNDIGLNVKWDATDNQTYVLDFSNSVSKLNPNNELSSIDADVGYGPSAPGGLYGTDVGIAGVGSNSLPYPTNYGPSGVASEFLGTNVGGQSIIGSHVLPMSSQRNKDTVNQFKLQGTWKDDKLTLDYGVQYLSNSENINEVDSFGNNQWQAYAGYGPASHNYASNTGTVGYVDANGNPLDATGAIVNKQVGNTQYTWSVTGENPQNNPSGVSLPVGIFGNTFSTGSGFISGFSNGSNLPAQVLAYNPYNVLNFLQGLGNPYATGFNASNPNPATAGFNYGNACASTSTVKDSACTPAAQSAGPVSTYNGTYQMVQSTGSYQVIDEHTTSFFLKATQKSQLGSMPLTIMVGARYERTTLTSQGLSAIPTSLAVQATDHTAFLVKYLPTQAVTETNAYNYLLPNLDFNLAVTDEWKMRLDLSQTLTRPALSQISPDQTVGSGQRVGALVATGQNPDLLPYLADNVDLGAEYYYAQNSYVSADAFLKNITNFVTTSNQTIAINNVIDPTTNQLAQFNLSTVSNSSIPVQVRGLELAWQHVFGDSGVGYQLNATFVNTNDPYNPNNLASTGNPITGLANSWNAMVFYDNHGFGIRLSADHQAEQLVQMGQQQNNSGFSREPTYIKANTYIDMSANYDFTPNYSVYLTGNNLGDEAYATRGRFSDQILDVVDTGRKFTFGFRAKL